MKEVKSIAFGFFLVTLLLSHASAQSPDCIALDSTQQKLYLNGDNLTLIENALRCFKLSSVAKERDSLIRIWILEDDFPDTPTTWRVKMFEFGRRNMIPSVTLNILEWNYVDDHNLPVKCIKKIEIDPGKIWRAFESDVNRLNLKLLYKTPFINTGQVNVDYGMLIIQFLDGYSTETIDFTGLWMIADKNHPLVVAHSKRIILLLKDIEKYFSISLSVDSKGKDFLKDTAKKLNLK